MSYTTDLLDAAKLAQGITSDYRLAQVLGVARGTVSSWRIGRTFPLHSMACELARLSGREPGAVLLGVGVDRLQAPEARPAVRRLGQLFRESAGAD